MFLTPKKQLNLLKTPVKINKNPKTFDLLCNDFLDIKEYFNNLNQDQSHFYNSNDICTPMECVKEMVDSVPESFWQQKDLKILDPCCGNGNFFAYITTKINLKNLYFNEINPKRIANLKKYFGNNINFSNHNFLDFNQQNTFDLVVANPPYAKFSEKNIRVSKNHNLSRDFIKKALQVTKIGGYILFIVPNNWMSFSDRNLLPQMLSEYQFITIDIHGAKKWFPKVGSSFTWFLLQKIENCFPCKISNNYILQDNVFATIDKNSKFIPLYYSEVVRNIVNKTINNNLLPKYKVLTSSYLHHYTKKNLFNNFETAEFKYKVIHTPTQIVWSKKPHKYQDFHKVLLSLTNQYKVFTEYGSGITQSIAFIICKSLAESQNIAQELDNPVYKFLNNITRYGNFNNIRVLQNLPILSSFELTNSENNFILEFNNKYYGKEEK